MSCYCMLYDAKKADDKWTEFFKDPESWWSNTWTDSQPPVNLKPKQLRARRHNNNKRLETQHPTVRQLITGLKHCSKLRDLEAGKRLHSDAVQAGLHTDVYVAATLVTLYSRCRSLPLAKQAFDAALQRDVVIWNSLIQAYFENRSYSLAMETFTCMDVEPDCITYTVILKACGSLAAERVSEKGACLNKGTFFHEQIKARGFNTDTPVANTLVGMYSKCGNVQRAKDVFEGMVSKDVVSWTSLMQGYVENDELLEAVRLFRCMDCQPDSFTYAAAAKACGGLGRLNEVLEIHEEVKKLGFNSDVVVSTTLLDMYAKCGSMKLAREVFDGMTHRNVVTWTSLMLGYVENHEYSVAIEIFSSMDCEPDSHAYVAMLKACGKKALTSLKQSERELCRSQGIYVHQKLRECSLDREVVVATSLVDMYCSCGEMQLAREVFENMPERNVFTWTCVIMGYVENGESLIAVEAFTSMDCKPDSLTFVAALKACGSLNSLAAGKRIHGEACKSGLDDAQLVVNSLVDFYARCSSKLAAELFNAMQTPDVVSWNSVMVLYSSLGESRRVFELARSMQEGGVPMDGITFTCILTACSHAGLVKDGRRYFEFMLEYGLRSSIEHYNCMVDLLGRAKRLQEALEFIGKMPLKANGITWITLLGACKKWKNAEVGRVAFHALLKSGTKRSAAYVLMSDIYASVGMWSEAKKIDIERDTCNSKIAR